MKKFDVLDIVLTATAVAIVGLMAVVVVEMFDRREEKEQCRQVGGQPIATSSGVMCVKELMPFAKED